MDPITLDPLAELTYPPFALVANEPYEPVPEWPPNEENKVETPADRALAEEERQRRILEEQWGGKLKQNETSVVAAPSVAPASTTTGTRHYNLYDGRALAYYLVSQLQFIDPLNRRDLTRDELINLDQYLRRHGLEQAGVVEAYDAKGITISTAGSTAATAAGRAEILQQQAAQLLRALFGGGGIVGGRNQRPTPPSRTTAINSNNNNHTNNSQNLFQQQYESHQQQYRQRRNNQDGVEEMDETGIYGDHGGGMLIVDDDINPSLRGVGISDMAAAVEEAQYLGPHNAGNSLWSASHIRGRFGATTPALMPDHFPVLTASALPSSAPSAQTAVAEQPSSSEAAPSKSLLKIVKAVKKTNPEELQRQRDAREEALRRAMMSNLSFGADPTALNGWTNTVSAVPDAVDESEATGPSVAQLQRNKALAEALGVKPATIRNNTNLFSGWARPYEGKIELDEYGNELNTVIYPDALILRARERLGPLLKLERKWKTFLASDTAASLPLQPMDRPTRAFIHEYAEFWKLKTESFDPEPRRYIHCVKLRETCAPNPLLSDAVKNWRGPTLTQLSPPVSASASPPLTSTPAPLATPSSLSVREFPPPPERVPLPLKPRSVNPSSEERTASNNVSPQPRLVDSSGDETQSATGRFESLFTGRERPKLTLAPRTRPLELPPFQPPALPTKLLGEALQEKMAAKARKEKAKHEKKKQILEAEFASSDEDADSDSSSEWEDEAPLYPGSDGE